MTINYEDYNWGDEDENEEPEFDEQDFNGNTDLVLALREKNFNLAKKLLNEGANIENVNSNGYTPLSEASEKGDLDTVKFLLENNAEYSDFDFSALERTIAFGEYDVFTYLIGLNKVNIENNNILDLMGRNRNIKMIKFFVDENLINIKDPQIQIKLLKMSISSDSKDYLISLVEDLKINVFKYIKELSEEIDNVYQKLANLKFGKDGLLKNFNEILHYLIIDIDFNVDLKYIKTKELEENINKTNLFKNLSKKYPEKDDKEKRTKI